ncbi:MULTISPECIES: hypothetical protein [Pseudomonas]|uniref:Acid-shock protein n=1 Tax=Pseudomonas eucalypticola TaxID=2599595 RepID=A0A7D5HS16_9PSED|nr:MULTISPECIES: hypothetical protein [Pseudomonas]QKZ07208.1 hypothetical protein HWQ56_26880 [Pseudomonas eucalypticola]
MRISLFAPAAALLGLFAINAQAANMATMANSPNSHDTHSQQQQKHKAPQPVHKKVVVKKAPPHKPLVHSTRTQQEAPNQR